MTKIPNIVKNLLKSIIIGIVLLFAGLVLSFILLRNLPIDIAVQILLGRGIYHPTPEEIEAVRIEYGLDQPLIIQFFIYVIRFFIGRWEYSHLFNSIPIGELLRTATPRIFEVSLLPLIVGAIAGGLIGILSIKTRFKWLKRIIQILNVISYALPVIMLAFLFQFGTFLTGILSPTGYKYYMNEDPPFVTGFRIWDSILARRWDLALDTAAHYILPGLVLGITTSAIIIKVFRINRSNQGQKTSIIYNTSRVLLVFGLIFSYAIFVDYIFNLAGLGYLFIFALLVKDFFLLQDCFFVILITLVLVSFVFNILYSVYHLLAEKKIWPTTWLEKKRRAKDEPLYIDDSALDVNEKKEHHPAYLSDFKRYFLNKLKSPLTIIGSIISIFFLVISIVPGIITPYSRAEVKGVYSNDWVPPSPEHPFGTSRLGRDVLALTVYGLQESLVFGIFATLIGLGGGLLFGYLANNQFYNRKFHRWFIRWPIMGGMFLFYIIPIFILIPMIFLAFGEMYLVLLATIGILLIPIFTWIFVKTKYKLFELLKKLIIYIPLLIGFSILIYELLGFLGFYDPKIFPQLGANLGDSREYMYSAPWATFWTFKIILSLTIIFFLIL